MKLKSILVTFALAALCSCAQTNTQSSKYRPAESFTEFIGLDVFNMQNEKLGIVRHITVDLENARVVEVAISPDKDISGDGSALVAVPPRALALDEAKHALRLNASKAKFAAAPKFTYAHMEESTQRARVAEVIRYFGLQPWFYLDGQTPRENTQILKMGHVKRTDQILSLPIANQSGQHYGKVGTLRMDLPKGHIIHVVAVTGGSRSVIQARALRYNSTRDGLILDSSAAELVGEPRFRWLNSKKTSYQEETYVNRDVQADKGFHSEQNAAEGKARSSITMEQGDNFRDKQKTALIKQAIRSDPNLSANAKNVEVSTLNAQTTLRGHVNTEADKARIGVIAVQAGRAENVSNLLEVRPVSGNGR